MSGPDPKLNSDASPGSDLWGQLTNAITLVAKQDQIVWTVFGVFWAANVLLLGALFVTGQAPKRFVGIILCAAGTVLAIIWTLIHLRAVHFLSFYEKVQASLEEKLLKGRLEFSLSSALNSNTFAAAGSSLRARRIMLSSSLGSLIVWIIGTLVFICYRHG